MYCNCSQNTLSQISKLFVNLNYQIVNTGVKDHDQPVHLPLVCLGAEGEECRLVSLGCGVEELGDEAVRVDRVVVDQLGQGWEPGLSSDEILKISKYK